MRLTTKGRYAVTAMLDLALHQQLDAASDVSKAGDVAVTLSDIAENQNISLAYLEQLFAKLRHHGLVEGVRGPGGGYRLARDVDSISMAQIITAVDEPMEFMDCGGKENCHDGEKCISHHVWSKLTDEIDGFLSNIYLGEMMRESALEIQNSQQHGKAQQDNEAAQHVALPIS